MLEKIKGWLGIHGPAIILSLEERHQKANAKAEDAISLFDRIVVELDEAVGDLRALAQEAADKAQALLAQSGTASEQAEKNAIRAEKIRDLLA